MHSVFNELDLEILIYGIMALFYISSEKDISNRCFANFLCASHVQIAPIN